MEETRGEADKYGNEYYTKRALPEGRLMSDVLGEVAEGGLIYIEDGDAKTGTNR
jgi:hypothetical protein